MKLFVQIFFYKVLGKIFLCFFTRFKVVREQNRLNENDTFVIFSNHSSHLDVIILMSALPIGLMKKVHPIGAEDYFARNALLKFFTEYVMNAVLISRKIKKNMNDPFQEIQKILDKGHSIILFPEGTRGKSDSVASFKPGIAYILKQNPDVFYLPVYIEGAGKVLPKGSKIIRPHQIKVNFGIPKKITGEENSIEMIVNKLESELKRLT